MDVLFTRPRVRTSWRLSMPLIATIVAYWIAVPITSWWACPRRAPPSSMRYWRYCPSTQVASACLLWSDKRALKRSFSTQRVRTAPLCPCWHRVLTIVLKVNIIREWRNVGSYFNSSISFQVCSANKRSSSWIAEQFANEEEIIITYFSYFFMTDIFSYNFILA